MTIATDPKQITYDRESHDYRASYEGNVIGWYNSYLEAEQALDAFASDLLHQTAIDTADMAADRAAELSTEAPLLITLQTPPAAPSASTHINTPVSTLPSILSNPGASGDILAMYRAAYGWACVQLDEQLVIDRVAA